jgi:hypothetical protein
MRDERAKAIEIGHKLDAEDGGYPPPGCHCTSYCAAPIVMGQQMPCRRSPPEVPGCRIPYSHQGRPEK